MIYYVLAAIMLFWVGGWLLSNAFAWYGVLLGILLFIGGIATTGYGLSNSEWAREGHAERVAQEAADAQPRVIREIDGCKVYAFKAS